jgi:hypothetical protein
LEIAAKITGRKVVLSGVGKLVHSTALIPYKYPSVGVLHLNAIPVWTPFGTVGLDKFKSWTPIKLVKIYQSRSVRSEGIIFLPPRAWSADFFTSFRWPTWKLDLLIFISKVRRAME